MADTLHAVARDQLQAERERLVEQLQRLGHGAETSLDFDENFADSGQVTAERGEVEALAGQLEETLTEIDDALAKLDAGAYGDCESCHQPIADARLEAMPAARLCMTCASQRR
ncbi:MAG: TraR/DksA family transcriptional regulator [Acidimicrobiia bacterium]